MLGINTTFILMYLRFFFVKSKISKYCGVTPVEGKDTSARGVNGVSIHSDTANAVCSYRIIYIRLFSFIGCIISHS